MFILSSLWVSWLSMKTTAWSGSAIPEASSYIDDSKPKSSPALMISEI